MISTTDERGIVNNFSREPLAYPAEYPTPAEQKRYWILGVASACFMAGVLALALAVS